MVDPNTELPNVEEPKVEAKVEPQVDDLLAELAKAGVTNAEELQGKLAASREAGNSARLLGDAREEARRLKQELSALSTKSQPQQDFMDYPEGQTIDIESAISKGVNRVLDARDAKAREAQQKSIEAWNRIQTDEDYNLIKDVWEEKLKDPGFVFKVQSGQTDPIAEYQTTLRKFYKTLLKKSHETITTMKGGKLKPPHVETGERSPANLVSEGETDVSAHRLLLNKLNEKIQKGYIPNEDEEALIAEAVLMTGGGS